jgi:hypothetical protein
LLRRRVRIGTTSDANDENEARRRAHVRKLAQKVASFIEIARGASGTWLPTRSRTCLGPRVERRCHWRRDHPTTRSQPHQAVGQQRSVVGRGSVR